MASVRKHLTKSVVDGMKPDEIIWDTKLIGFGVRYQRRDKVFVYKCRIGNRQRWFAIGKYGQPWTVAEVENRVRVIQGDIANDLDPAAIREERDRNPTLRQAGKTFLETVVSKRRKVTQVLYNDFFERLTTPAKFVVIGGLADQQNRAGSADRHIPFTANVRHQFLSLIARQDET